MKKPDLSFVIPAYNAQNFLADAILSCLRQSHKNIEIVVVNDGSSDGTSRIVKHFMTVDKRVVGIHTPKNMGRGHARNLGNTFARGGIIAVLDADDMADIDRAKTTLKCIDGAGVLYGAANVVNAMGEPIARIRAEPFDLKVALEKRTNFIVHSTMAYATAVTCLAKYDTGEYSKLGLDDWKFQLDLALAGVCFKHTDKILAAWRENVGQITNTRDSAKVAELKARYVVKEVA